MVFLMAGNPGVEGLTMAWQNQCRWLARVCLNRGLPRLECYAVVSAAAAKAWRAELTVVDCC